MTDIETQKRSVVRFDGTITLGNILTAMAMAASFFIYAVTVETRFQSLSDKDIELEKRMERSDTTHTNSLQEIRNSLHRIEDKLDQKADKPR